jgi:hypothetical protein
VCVCVFVSVYVRMIALARNCMSVTSKMFICVHHLLQVLFNRMNRLAITVMNAFEYCTFGEVPSKTTVHLLYIVCIRL